MNKLLISLVCVAALGVGCAITRAQKGAAVSAAGDVGMLFGIPRPLTEAAVASMIALVAHVVGSKRGEKRAAKKLGLPPGARIVAINQPPVLPKHE